MIAINDKLDVLNSDQIAFFQENGFIQLPGLLTSEEIGHVRTAMQRACAAGQRPADSYYSRVLDQRVNLWRQDASMREIVLNPRFAHLALQLTGAPRIRLFHDHALIKPGNDSKPTNWHQDTVYWPMQQDGALSIWIALDDVDEENGCLQFIPRSRDHGRLPLVALGEEDTDGIFRHLSEGKPTEVFVARMKAGGVTFHDGLTFHYANANTSGRDRHALAIIYMPDGVTYSGKPHVVTDGLGLQPGEPLATDLFPVLAERDADSGAR